MAGAFCQRSGARDETIRVWRAPLAGLIFRRPPSSAASAVRQFPYLRRPSSNTRSVPVVLGTDGLARRLRSGHRHGRRDCPGTAFRHLLARVPAGDPERSAATRTTAPAKAAKYTPPLSNSVNKSLSNWPRQREESLSSIETVQSATPVPDCSKSCMKPPGRSASRSQTPYR